MKTFLTILSLTLVYCSNSQTHFSIAPEISYTAPLIGYDGYDDNDRKLEFISSADSLSTFSSGLGFGARVSLDKKIIGLELGLRYANDIVYKTGYFGSDGSDGSERIHKMFGMDLGIWLQLFHVKKVDFYSRIGFSHVIMSVKQATFKINSGLGSTNIEKEIKKFYGGRGLGAYFGIGAKYRFKNRIQFFSELIVRPVDYRPTYKRDIKYSIDGISQPIDKDEQSVGYRLKMNTSSISANLGVKFTVF